MRTRRAHAALAVVAAALAAAPMNSCQLVTDFTLTPVSETSDGLCSDGRDNDFDGLADCQDWNCLDKAPCCDIPEVLLVDDFASGSCADAVCENATCAILECGPDEAVWHAWPCPYPRVCDGALRIHKTRLECYASGVLSRATVGLDPGLRVEVTLSGAPERRGYVEVALTIQDEDDLLGHLDECGRQQRVDGFAALRQIWAPEGYQIVAQFQQSDLATSPPIATPDQPHAIALRIGLDRRIVYELDGQVFAVADVPVPVTSEKARVAITGLTETAAVDAVRVEAGLRCPSPATWRLDGATLEDAIELTGQSGLGAVFDRDEVYHPAVRRKPDGGLEMFYTGCWWPSNVLACDPLKIGIGRVTRIGDGPFVRDAANPLLIPDEVPAGGLSGVRHDFSVAMLPEGGGYAAPTAGTPIYLVDDDLNIGEQVLAPNVSGQWDSAHMCCASALRHPDGTIYLWYAARVNSDLPWRIGLATSSDGVRFTRHPDNPVLAEGAPGDFDAAGVSSPTVHYDVRLGLFRMWYEGRDFFGKTSIGYAVSTDGVRWRRAPHNPVARADDFGLVTIGGPEVLPDADGRLRMWVHGTTSDAFRRRIFVLVNEGTLTEP